MKVNGYEIKPKADLQDADLRGANLLGTYLWDANLQGANFRGANLRYVNLQGANLRYTKLQGADFRGANLRGADFRGANLRGADLWGANLRGADLKDSELPHFSIVPEEGSFIGWKKLCDGQVIKVEIPADAKRTSSLVGRKCRAEYVKVLEGSGKSERGGVYLEGEIYRPDSYDDDIRVECTHGVHFFMTKKEAEEY